MQTEHAATETADPVLVVGRYRLERELARGGVGVVYRAFDLSTNRHVALKRLSPTVSNNPRISALFEREYHTLARLKHPRIVEVFDYGIDEVGPYYTMELLDGRDLSELAPIPYRDACRYLRDVASSLALLHTRKRLHRDLSPRNVRITSDGRCKLLDFGTMANFGVPDEIVGTPPMVPPEALRAMSLDHRSDLYSLGALAYRLLTTRHAYRARQLEDLPELWRTPPPRVSELVEDVPVELDDLVMSMLSLDPVYRPVSTSEVIDRLTSIGELPPDDDLVRTAESYLLSSRLIGRSRPMETIHRRIARAHAKQGGAVLIEGNPGVGKTRLLDEAALQAQLTGALTIRVEARSNRGPNAVAQAIAKGIMHAAPHDAREAAVPHAPVLAHFFDAFESDQPRASLPGNPGVLRTQLHAAFQAWLLAVSEDHTLVILVDDLHRVDEGSAALLGVLTQEAKHRRVLLIATRRLASSVSAPEAVAAIADQSRRIRIHRLRRKDTLLLIRSMFGDVPNVDELGNWIHDITTGSPTQIIELSRHLADKRLIRFSDGMWVLPPSVPKDQLPLSLAATMSARAAALSPAERGMAEALCVRRGAIPLQLCLALAEEKTPADVFRTIDELVAKGVLADAPDGYHFGQEALREVLLSELAPERGQLLHRRLGEALLAGGAQRPEERVEAGWHVLRGGDERRGADLLAEAAPKLAGRGIATSAALPALEAALELYEKQGRAPRECLRLRTTMVGSLDRRICARYGDETAIALLYYAGAPMAETLRPLFGATASLVIAVLLATMRRWLTPHSKRGPRPLTAIAAFYRTAYALMTMRTSTMDIVGMERLTTQAEMLSAAGPMGQVTALFLRGATFTLRSMPEQARNHQQKALELAKASQNFGGRIGSAARRGVIASIYIGLGMIETQYSVRGQRALDMIDELAKLTSDPSVLEPGSAEIAQQGGITTPELTMAAHQIRMVYHLMRGEREKAEAHRDKLHMHTIQTGLQFQFDVWRTLIDLRVAQRMMDLAALRRSGELLVQLTPQYPVLAPFLDQSRAYLSFSLGKPQEALTTMAKWIPAVKPGDIAGWDSLYTSYADMLLAVGDPHRARELMQTALASDAAREAVPSAMTLTLELQLARAEAELHDTASALARIDRLMEQMKDADQPVMVGLLHEVGAKVADQARDRGRRDAHVDLMKRWYALTRNPSLLMRAQRVAEGLRELETREGHAPSIPPSQEAVTRVTTQRQIASIDELFDDCKNLDERAARALHIIVEQCAGTSGHLYLWREERLRLVANLSAREATDDVERLLSERFEATRANIDPPTPGDAHAPMEIAVVAPGSEGGTNDERCATIMLATGGRSSKLIGAVALRIGSEMLRPIRKSVLEAIARNVTDEITSGA